MNFKQWFYQSESSARTRAATSPSIPPRADLVFARPPYSQLSFCRKIGKKKISGNVDVTSVCSKKKRKKKKD